MYCWFIEGLWWLNFGSILELREHMSKLDFDYIMLRNFHCMVVVEVNSRGGCSE